MSLPALLRWILIRLIDAAAGVCGCAPSTHLHAIFSSIRNCIARAYVRLTMVRPALQRNGPGETDVGYICGSDVPGLSTSRIISLNDSPLGDGDEIATNARGVCDGSELRSIDAQNEPSAESVKSDEYEPSLLQPGSIVFPDNTRPCELKEMTPVILPRSILRDTDAFPDGLNPSEHSLVSFTTVFTHNTPDELKPGVSLGEWQSFTHPRGYLYYSHPEKRIWTTAYMHSKVYNAQVIKCVALLERYNHGFTHSGPLLPEGYELVIDVMPDQRETGKISWGYYYIQHASRSIFWLDTKVLKRELAGMKGPLSPDHVVHKVQHLYWRHIYLFPHGNRDIFAQVSWNELLGVLEYNLQDLILFPSSTTCLYSQPQMEHMRGVVQRACNMPSRREPLSPHLLSMLAQAQMLMSTQRFYHGHGQSFVRLQPRESIFSPANETKSLTSTLISATIDGFLLGEQIVILQDIHRIMVDDMVPLRDWNEFLRQLVDQWARYFLGATVMLAVNLSLLAVPGVVVPATNDVNGAASQACVFLSSSSLLLAFGSMATAQALTRHLTAAVESRQEPDMAFVSYRDMYKLSPGKLSALYSSPYVLLTWSFLFFVNALAYAPFAGIVFCTIINIAVALVCGHLVGIVKLTWPRHRNAKQPRPLMHTPNRRQEMRDHVSPPVEELTDTIDLDDPATSV